MEGEHVGRFGGGIIRIPDSGGIFSRDQERVWRRRREFSKSSRIEEVGVRRKNDRGVCTRILKNS